MYIPRKLDLHEILQKKSLFLFGARQTGKSSLIRNTLKNIKTYNLLESDTFLSLNQRPARLREEVTSKDKIIIIDEIQKIPQLLDEIHWLIEEKGIRFLMTGSSSRKLRQGGINLLGGRARHRTLHPFVKAELKNFDLLRALNNGLLPSLYLSDSPDEDLKAYCGDYLQNEIYAEGLTRNLPAFSRFLEVAALSQGNLINYTQIANDSQVKLTTVREYFQILKDTLIAFELLPFKKTKKRKAIVTSKFYFFDVGVARFLQNRSHLRMKTPEFGEAFETYIFHELKSFCDYKNRGELTYWRSKSAYEVDFIINDQIVIEVKAKENITLSDLKGLISLKEEKLVKELIVVSLEKRPRVVEGIHIVPWDHFLDGLWTGEWQV